MSNVRQQKLPTVSQGAFSRTKSGDDDVTSAWGPRRSQQFKHRNSWPTIGEGQPSQRTVKLPQLSCLREDLPSWKTPSQQNNLVSNDAEVDSDCVQNQPSMNAVEVDPEFDLKASAWSEQDVRINKEPLITTTPSCHCPSPSSQRRIIAALQSTSSPTIKQDLDNFRSSSEWTYTVADAWYQRWEDHVRRRSTCGAPVSGQRTITAGPGPVDMDIDDDDRNIHVNEETWKRFVTWYGISPSHQLDRRHPNIKDEKIYEVCILSPFSGIVEHRSKKFSNVEEVGYVELQLRRVFNIDGCNHDFPRHWCRLGHRSRLWITEKVSVPRFCQLLHRKATLGDCVQRNSSYILALEIADDCGTWPSGEPGEPDGDLSCYDELSAGGTETNIEEDFFSYGEFTKCWNDYVETGLADLSVSLADEVQRTVERYVADMRRTRADSTNHLDRRRKAAETRLRQLDERLASLAEEEDATTSLETKLMTSGDRLSAEQSFLENCEKRFREETRLPQRDPTDKSASFGDSRIRLDVGGQVYTTSIVTLRRYPDSLLGLAFNGSYQLHREADGTYFIDRDSRHFRLVLNFMRDGRLEDEIKKTILSDRSTLRELLCEAKYYRLTSLVEQLVELWKQSQEP